MPSFKKLLRHIDMLVTPYEFNVTKSQKSLTKLGGVFSLIILLLMIIYSISIYISTVQKKQSIFAGTQIVSEIEQLDQNSSLIVIQFSTSINGEVIQFNQTISSYFSLQIDYVHQARPENSTQFQRNVSNLNLSLCSQSTIQKLNLYSNAPTVEQSQNFLCIDGKYQLSGSFFEKNYNYLKISIIKCANDTKCKNDQEFQDFINQGININLFILDSQIKQTLDIAEPSKENSYIIFWRLNSLIANSEDIYLQPIIIDYINNKNSFSMFTGNANDRERIFNSSRVERQERRQYPIDLESDQNLCTFYIRTSQDSQYFFAQKQDIVSLILDAVSQATGLSVAILGATKILYKMYMEHETYTKVMNQVFKFDFRDKVVQRENANFHQNFLADKSKSLDQIFKNQLDFSFLMHLKIRLKKHFGFCKCCKRDFEKKVQMAQIAKSKIMTDLELTNIVKKLYEIDCLKLLLFDDDQLKLFNSFSQPVLQKNIVEHGDLLKKMNKEYQRANMKESVVQKYELKHQQTEGINFEDEIISTIPIDVQLSKISRFFKAQLKAQNGEELLNVYGKIVKGSNHNEKMNDRLLNFIRYNNILFQMVDFTHQKKTFLENQLQPPVLDFQQEQIFRPKQFSQDNFFKSEHFASQNNQEEGKNSNIKLNEKSAYVSIQSSPKRGYIKQNKGDNQVDQIDFDEIKIDLDNQVQKSTK